MLAWGRHVCVSALFLYPIGMAIQVERAVRAIKHELGQSFTSGMTELECIELMYSKLFEMKSGWFWATRTIELDTVAGLNLIRLPEDFVAVLWHVYQDPELHVLTDDKFGVYKQRIHVDGAGSGGQGCPNYCRVIGPDDGGPALEFLENFTTSETGRFTLSIEVGPLAVTDASQELPLPRYMHNVFLSLVRAKAKELQMPEEYPAGTLVDAVFRSSDWAGAIRADNRRHPQTQAKDYRLKSIGQGWPFSNSTAPVIIDGVEHWPN